MNGFENFFSGVQQGLFEAVVQPVMFALGLGNLLEDAYEATAWFMAGRSRSSFCWPSSVRYSAGGR